MKRIFILAAMIILPLIASAQNLHLNKLGYFEERGINVLVYSNNYGGGFCDEKLAGIEIIQRGERIATGGGIRLMNTPEQWDIYPDLKARNLGDDRIDLELVYKQYDNFTTFVSVAPKGKGFSITVNIDKPVPEFLEGKAGLNLEFFPATFFGHTYMMDGSVAVLPHYPAGETHMRPVSEKVTQFYGLTTFDDRGRNEFIVPEPMAQGHTLVLAPECDDLRVKITSEAEINLFDGRNLSQNGTFVVRSLIPVGKTGKVLEWYVEPYYDAAWVRKPNVGFSQVGYTPAQKKVAVVELDKNDNVAHSAKIWKYDAEGGKKVVLEPIVTEWGVFNNRYNYARFDFSQITEPGLYAIEYDGVINNVFPINKNVYDGLWHTSMDVWLPAQMDHMEVNEAYRIWHGRSNMDDALQAPVNYQQMDGYTMSPVTNTKYKDFERIPGLTVGGWYDAGDFDIQGDTVVGMIANFSTALEACGLGSGILRDETFIDQETQFVDIHRPDGVPDIYQQIEHGVLNVLAQVENIGFVCHGIVQGTMHQYHHVGDGSTQTDGKIYDPSLKPYEIRGIYSGTRDERLAFTDNFSPFGQMTTAAGLAAAARTLKDYKPELAAKCLKVATELWDEYASQATADNMPKDMMSLWRIMREGDSKLNAAIQLYITTREKKYLDFCQPEALRKLADTSVADARFSWMNDSYKNIDPALALYPYLDKKFQKTVRDAIPRYVEMIDNLGGNNPYNVPVMGRGWGGNEQVIFQANEYYRIWKLFPDLVDPQKILNAVDFLYGCHPYSNVSFVTAIGVNVKKVAYGNNRGDYTAMPGGIVPGLLQLAPDYFECKDDYPFLWGENESCTRTVPHYVMLSIAAEEVAAYLNAN